MGRLILHALGIDEVRELFSGSEGVATSLRGWAAVAFPTPEAPARTGLLDRLGPISRRGAHPPVVRPGVPTGRDLEDITHGRDVPPDRLTAAWALVDVWLEHMAWSTLVLDTHPSFLDSLDFTASLAGVPAADGVRHLLNHQLALPLKEPPGQTSGYVRGAHAAAMARTWRAALPHMEGTDPEPAERLTAWLSGFDAWETSARAEGRPAPDLVALHRDGARQVS